jgi:hypothetical protein
MKNDEFKGKQVLADAMMVLNFAESLPLLIKSAMRSKCYRDKWFRCIGFKDLATANAFMDLGWGWKVLYTEEYVWLAQVNDEGSDEPDTTILHG